MSENKPQDEIDLLTVFAGIKKLIFDTVQGIKRVVNFSIQNIIALIVFVLIGIGISLGIFFIKKSVYVSDLTLTHNRLTNVQCLDLVNSISKASNKDSELSKKLNIPTETAKQIKSITYKQLHNSAASDSLKGDFKIEVKVYNTSILDTLQNRILYFLESNEYAKKRKEINSMYLDKLEDRIKKQILSIDSLKDIVDRSIIPKSLGNGIIVGESIDPVKVYQESLILYQSQLKIANEKEMNNSFEIVVGFSPAVPVSKLTVNLIIGGIAGYIVGLIVLWRKKNKLATA